MKIAIHQPNYLPWIGFFDKMDMVDKFVLLDTALYTRSEFTNRNKVRIPQGWKWLTVPVRGKRIPINEVVIDNSQNWRSTHWRVIVSNYKKTPYWKDYYEGFEHIYSQKWDKTVDLNTVLIMHIKELLCIDTEILIESDLNKDFGNSNARNINIVKSLECGTYISGTGAKEYNDELKFKENNIKLFYQNFVHPVYPQRWEGFERFMSIIDMLFNCGPETISLLRKARN